jgi:hypothetical protein
VSWDSILESGMAFGARVIDALGTFWSSQALELLAFLIAALTAVAIWQARATIRLRAELAAEIKRSEYWQAASERSASSLRRRLGALEEQYQGLMQEQEASRLRGSRVDFTVARSLARTGANCSQLEDCGLSRGEAQLITALHGHAAR